MVSAWAASLWEAAHLSRGLLPSVHLGPGVTQEAKTGEEEGQAGQEARPRAPPPVRN